MQWRRRLERAGQLGQQLGGYSSLFDASDVNAAKVLEPSQESPGRPLTPHSHAPVPPSNQPFRHTYNPLFSNAFCVCQIDTVLHYYLRTESKTESKRGGNGWIFGMPRTPWHTQNGPEPRVAWGKSRSDKANREQLALNSGGWGSTKRSSATRMNAGFSVWCMIQLLEELLYVQSLDFF